MGATPETTQPPVVPASAADPAVEHVDVRGRLSGPLGALVVAVLVGVLVAAPFLLNSYRIFVLALILVYALGVLGFNVLVGWAGQIGLAHAGFFGLGAYGSALLMTAGVNFWVAMALIGVVAVLLGAVIGWPAVQLRGFFLAIATLAFGELIVRGFAEARDLTGGGAGLEVPTFRVFGLNQTVSSYYLALIVAVVGYLLLWRALRGRFGRTLKAVRDVEVATGPIGISAARYKLYAFSVSALVATISGVLFAQLNTFIFPDMFGTNLLVILLVMLLVGGVASIAGSIIGSIFGVVIVELLQDLGTYQRFAYGLALIAIVRFLPGGIASVPARLRNTRMLGGLRT